MKKKLSKGFTLIELLVVIAIIGILAALVLVALGNARDKANDARVKSNVGQLRTLAEVFYDSNNASYTGLNTCFTTPSSSNCVGGIEDSVISLRSDLESATGVATPLTVNAGASAFCISSRLKTNTDSYVCVDASGEFKEGTAYACGSGTACP